MTYHGVPRGILLVGALVCLGALVGGYAVFSGADSDAAAPIGENASANYAAVDGFTARMTVVREVGGDRNRSVYRVKRRPGERYYYRRALANESDGPELVVVNRTTLWSYDRDDDTVERSDITGLDRFNTSLGERLDALFAKVNADRGVAGVETPTPGVAPVPVVPVGSAPTPTGNASAAGSGYNVTYVGTATVDGRQVYHVRVQGNLFADDVTANFTQDIWFDSEHFVPLQYHYVWTNDGQRNRVRVRYSNVTFDPGLTDETFRFDPEDVPGGDPRTLERRNYESRAALEAAARTSVPDPPVPDRFAFAYGTYQDRDPRELVLRYRNGSDSLVVFKSQQSDLDFPTDPERVQVGNHSGRIADYGPDGETLIVAWECARYDYVVVTQTVPRDRTLALARAVGCS